MGPFDESLLVYEDWEFLIRLSRKFDFQHIAKITGEYRRRDDNSNILEQERYLENEQVVKRRFMQDRDTIFDEKFKRIFQQQHQYNQCDAAGFAFTESAGGGAKTHCPPATGSSTFTHGEKV